MAPWRRGFRHYPDGGVTIALQINTDTGVIASEKNALGNIEARLVQVLVRDKD